MIIEQNLDFNLALAPTSVASATQATAAVDTEGYNLVTFAILSTAPGATTAPTALAITECDTVGGTYTPIVAFTGGAAVDATHGFVIPAGSASAGVYAVFNVDTRKRKRFLKLSVTNTTTQTLAVLAILGRPDVSPVGTTVPGNVGASGIVVTG